MRATLVLALAAAFTLGCSGGETDSDTDAVDTSDDGITSAERLGVPEKYRFLWNTTQGCETGDGGRGTQVYWHTDDAESIKLSENRYSFSATETWYWFGGDDSPTDCKDTWRLTGEFVTTDYELLGCAGCEEAYTFRRELIEQGCNVLYHQIYGYDEGSDAPDPQVYTGFVMLDTHGEFNDQPNEDNKILVVARYRRPDGRYSLNNQYSQPNMSHRTAEDPLVIGPPGRYEWVGTSCIGSGGGGGA